MDVAIANSYSLIPTNLQRRSLVISMANNMENTYVKVPECNVDNRRASEFSST